MGKFRIKISRALFKLEGYVVFKYNNGGFFWRKIQECKQDNLTGWSSMVDKVVHLSNVESVISKFNTIEDIKLYEEKERQKMIEWNRDLALRKQKNKEEIRNLYKKYSK